MDIGVIISLAAVLISVLSLLLNGRKDVREDAAGTARLEAKLDSISSGVEDIRVETRAMRGRVTDSNPWIGKLISGKSIIFMANMLLWAALK